MDYTRVIQSDRCLDNIEIRVVLQHNVAEIMPAYFDTNLHTISHRPGVTSRSIPPSRQYLRV